MSKTDTTEFKLDLEEFGVTCAAEAAETIKQMAFGIYFKTILKTPIDKGLLRGAWTLALGSPSDANKGKPSGQSPGSVSGQEALHANAVLREFSVENMVMIWLSNAMPYVGTVEFGGYPKMVKKGTYVKKGKTRRIPGGGAITGPGHVILSSGGFSKQSPQGMLMLSIEEELSALRSNS